MHGQTTFLKHRLSARHLKTRLKKDSHLFHIKDKQELQQELGLTDYE